MKVAAIFTNASFLSLFLFLPVPHQEKGPCKEDKIFLAKDTAEYAKALNQAMRDKKSIVVAVDFDPPLGEWYCVRIKADLIYGTAPNIMTIGKIKEIDGFPSIEWLEDLPATTNADKIAEVLKTNKK